MPAKSKSQQRLFGMVHAYNKGEFHGPRGLRARLARLSKHISDEDASHFAQTPHKGLPEKTAGQELICKNGGMCARRGPMCNSRTCRYNGGTKTAQEYLRPDQANDLASFLSSYAQPVDSMTRSARRRSFLSRVIPGVLIGATVGGLGAGGLGAYVAGKAARRSSLPAKDISEKVREAALHAGLWGAGHGAAIGGATGIGLGVLDKLRGQ